MLIDEEVYSEKQIEDFLEHHGVKGQKWGVRGTKRFQTHLDRLDRIARGTGTKNDSRKTGIRLNPRGQKTAAKLLSRGASNQNKVLNGRKKAAEVLLKAQGVRIRDLNYHQPTLSTPMSSVQATKQVADFMKKNPSGTRA